MEFIDVSAANSHTELPEPENLLEECWFFGNLFTDSKSKMSKSYSDLDPPSNHTTREEMSFIKSERSSSATPMEEDPKGVDFHLRRLVRAPSLPSYMEPKVDMFHPVKEKYDSGGTNLITQNNLIREQSLPPCFGKQEEDEDEESDFELGRLITQASLNSSHILPPKRNLKAQSSSFPTKTRPRKRTDQLKSNNMDMRDQYLSDGTRIRRSSSDIQTKEVKSLKKTWCCVEGNCRDKTKEKMVKNYSPTIPNWCDDEKRSSQDMKTEIKFWARAVASNVATPNQLIANRN